MLLHRLVFWRVHDQSLHLQECCCCPFLLFQVARTVTEGSLIFPFQKGQANTLSSTVCLWQCAKNNVLIITLSLFIFYPHHYSGVLGFCFVLSPNASVMWLIYTLWWYKDHVLLQQGSCRIRWEVLCLKNSSQRHAVSYTSASTLLFGHALRFCYVQSSLWSHTNSGSVDTFLFGSHFLCW